VKYIPYPDPEPTTSTGIRPFTLGRALLEPDAQVQHFTIAQTAKPGGPAWESD
jgi:hypothetical protein